MKSIIFIAPPAAGKGTQSKLVCEKYNLPHISTGDLLRNEVASGSEMGEYLKQQMNNGLLVSDSIILKLLEARINMPDCSNGYVLDGFPRNVYQAKEYNFMLEKTGRVLGNVILIDVEDETLKRRIVGRTSCENCGSVYNDMIDGLMPKKSNVCDKCGSTLSKRDDDNLETFENRLKTYYEQTEPLIEYYKSLDVLTRVDGNLSLDTIFKSICNILEGDK